MLAGLYNSPIETIATVGLSFGYCVALFDAIVTTQVSVS